MEDFKVKWKKSIFFRMIITFILIIVPLYILGATIYNWAILTVKKEMSNTTLSRVEYYLDSLESQIKRIKMLQFDCINDENLRQLASLPESLNDYEKIQSVSRLQQRLVNIANSSEYINAVRVYIPAINRTLTTLPGGYKTSIDSNEFEALKSDSYNTTSQIFYWQDRLLLKVAYPNSIMLGDEANKKQPLFIISVELSKAALQKAVQKFNSYSEGGALLVDAAHRFILASDGSNEFNIQIDSLMKHTDISKTSGTHTVTINKKNYFIVYSKSDYLDMILCGYIPEADVFMPLKGYSIWFWFFTILAMLLVILYSFTTYRLIHVPLEILVKSFRKIKKGDLNVLINHNYDDEFKYLFIGFNEMVGELNILIDQVYKQKILTQNALLKQLQSQINPHFLYNSFFMLNQMVQTGDYDGLSYISEHLGNYFKYITRIAIDDVKLSQEVEHARIYTEIQAKRFRNRIRIYFSELPEEFYDLTVPRLILQPILENSIEHGLKDIDEDGLVKVSFYQKDSGLYIQVEDNGNGLSDEEMLKLISVMNSEDGQIENTGIINIHKRLRIKFGYESGITLEKSECGGLITRIFIRL